MEDSGEAAGDTVVMVMVGVGSMVDMADFMELDSMGMEGDIPTLMPVGIMTSAAWDTPASAVTEVEDMEIIRALP